MERETDISALWRNLRGFILEVFTNLLEQQLCVSLYDCVLFDVYLCEKQYDFYTWKVKFFLESHDILASPHIFTGMFRNQD